MWALGPLVRPPIACLHKAELTLLFYHKTSFMKFCLGHKWALGPQRRPLILLSNPEELTLPVSPVKIAVEDFQVLLSVITGPI